jgi:hypothetical protein
VLAWALVFVEPDATQAAPAERAVQLLAGSEPVSWAAALPPVAVLASELVAWTAGLGPVSTVAAEFLIRALASVYLAWGEAMERQVFPVSKGMASVACGQEFLGGPAWVSELALASASFQADSVVRVSPAELTVGPVDYQGDFRPVDYQDRRDGDSIPDGFPDAAVDNHWGDSASCRDIPDDSPR